MSGFIKGESRSQATLFPESLDDFIGEDSAVRVIDVFIDELDISGLGFNTVSAATGRPAYHRALYLRFMYTVILTECNQAVVWNVKRSVMLS